MKDEATDESSATPDDGPETELLDATSSSGGIGAIETGIPVSPDDDEHMKSCPAMDLPQETRNPNPDVQLKEEMAKVDARIYDKINKWAYKGGFAPQQQDSSEDSTPDNLNERSSSDDPQVSPEGPLENANEGSSSEEPDDVEAQTPTQSSGLAVASLVDIPQAEEWPEQARTAGASMENDSETKQWNKRKLYLALGMVCVFMVILPIVVAAVTLVHTSNNGKTDPSPHVSTNQQEIHPSQFDTPQAYLHALVPNHTIKAMDDPKSPQSRALGWILGDPDLLHYPSWRVRQRYALATFFYATGGVSHYGSGWIQSDSWLSYSLHECDWYQGNPLDLPGMDHFLSELGGELSVWDNDNYACVASGRYQSLTLFSNGLEGTIPPELFLLSELKGIALRGNQLTGPIPSQLGQLTGAMMFDIIGNSVSSSIPTQVGNLKTLQGFFAMNNKLSGPVPSQVGKMSSLILLFLVSNRLTGPLPSQLGGLSQLSKALLESNRFSGSLPSELGQLKVLELALHDNKFGGTIPTQYGNLQNATLLSLGENKGIHGTIPTQLGNMKRMANLGIWNTQISGTIPSQLGKLTKLEGLLFPNNQLSGALPSQLGALTSLWGLSPFNNRLSGPIPTQLVNAKGLMALQLNNNNFSGEIPSQIGKLKKVEFLDLSHNKLSGKIPSQMGMAKQTQELRLDHNQLTGQIPSTLGLLVHGSFSWVATLVSNMILPTVAKTAVPARSMALGHNQFTGSIPSELGNMKKLLHLSLEENDLVSTIPTELGLIGGMEGLLLDGNSLVGPLPSELGLLKSLHTLNVADNALSGTVPEELSLWSATAQMLDISDNQISGTLPDEICTETFNVSFFDCSPTLCGCDCPCWRPHVLR